MQLCTVNHFFYTTSTTMTTRWNHAPTNKEDNINIGRHQFEYAMQVGPSVTVNPIDHLKINAYFRYAPSFSGILINDEFSYNYASFFVTGAAISYKVISVGIESRWGKAKYKNFSIDDFNEGRIWMWTIRNGTT